MSAASRSAAVDEELVCFSDTIAPPRLGRGSRLGRISFPRPCGADLAKGEPPVRARIGWSPPRARSWISAMRRLDPSDSAATPAALR